jgi:hypothetical protein
MAFVDTVFLDVRGAIVNTQDWKAGKESLNRCAAEIV